MSPLTSNVLAARRPAHVLRRVVLLLALPALVGHCAEDLEPVPLAADDTPTTQLVRAGAPEAMTADAGAAASPIGDGTNQVGPASASCQQLEALLRERVASGFENGDLSCEDASDCSFTGTAIGCHYGCSGWLVGHGSHEATSSAVEQRIAPLCAQLGACPRGIPSCPYQATRAAECVEGRCRLFDDSPFTCEELAAQAASAYKAARDAGDHACAGDDDCTLFHEGPSCAVACDLLGSVATAAAGALTLTAGRAGSKYCNPFWERICAEPSAIACSLPEGEPRARCNAGRCDIEYLPAVD